MNPSEWRTLNSSGRYRILVTKELPGRRWLEILTLAASNIAAMLIGSPVWQGTDIQPFLDTPAPKAAPSILNAGELGLPLMSTPNN